MTLSIASTVTLNNGVAMPLFGMGTFRAAGTDLRRAMEAALETGYRLFDTASAYGNEAEVGAVLKDGSVPRDELFVTSKAWVDEQGLQETPAAFARSLRALGLDYLDLYLIHWPAPGAWPAAWEAMEAIAASGRCRAIGVSNFNIRHLEELDTFATVIPAVNQIELSPFCTRRDLVDYCRQHTIQPESYSPLTRRAKWDHPVLRQVAARTGKSPAQVLIRWQLQHEIVVIPKSADPAHIRHNADVFDFEIAPDDMAALDGLNEDFSVVAEGFRREFE
jgi:diketogulonate reductase-like aldo/keto reductase